MKALPYTVIDMIDVFISRPTWIGEEFKEGLDGFLSFLDTHDFKPRTLGSTDYPTESPLDEVISIMEECEGTIILGYPQIYVTRGRIRESENRSFLIPSEWNHIEATLAYMKKMPLLVIHHKGITRGIFERGAISKFIYEIDLSKNNWFLSDNVKGALKKWKASIVGRQHREPRVIESVSTPPSSAVRFDKDVESVLVYLFNLPHDEQRDLASIRNKFRLNEQAARYYVEKLLGGKMISRAEFYMGGYYYPLTNKGRDYVMTNKLVSH